MPTPGEVREQIWDELTRARAARYPLPPHGHHPNFAGARQAAERLLAHPELAPLDALIVGPERALYPLRRLALARGKTLYVPDVRVSGGYWRLSGDARAADLRQMPQLGQPAPTPGEARAAVLACVAADAHGGRLSKGFGWGRAGLKLGLPEFTLAHPLMLLTQLPCPPDSQVRLIATPGAVIGALGASP